MLFHIEHVTNFEEKIFKILETYSGKPCNLMISGGSLLDILSSRDYSILNTTKWKVFFADERANRTALNFTKAQEFLNMLQSKVFRIEIYENLGKSAFDYHQILQNSGSHIDVCLLGIGENGHICSIWPDSPIIKSNKLVEVVQVDCQVSNFRITTTLHFINNHVKNLFFVVPPKDGKIKDIKMPHSSIIENIKIEFTVFLAKP